MRAFRFVLVAGLLIVPLLSSPGGATLSVAWDVLPTMPGARTEVAAVAVGGRVWVLGGLGPTPAHGTRVDVFDPVANAWSTGPALPMGIHHTGALVVGSRILVLGGYTGTSFTPTSLSWTLDTSLPATLQAWTPFVPLPTPRGAHAAATDGARVWIFGGVGPTGLEASAYTLDAIAGQTVPVWRRIADLPDPRDHLAGAFLDGRVYAVGGRDLNLATNTGRLDAYDPAMDAWTQRASMPTPRGGIAAAALAGHLLVYGGEAPTGTFSTAEAYEAATNAWSAVAPMPTARHGLGAAVLGGAVYVQAGGPVPGLTFSGANERLRVL